jgi:hypothetical protein
MRKNRRKVYNSALDAKKIQSPALPCESLAGHEARMSSRKCAFLTLGTLLLAAWGAAPTAFAQSGDTDVGEVAGFGGVALGVGAKPSVGASTGVTISRYAMFSLETEFISLGDRTIQPWPPRSTITRSYLFDFGSDFHIRIPVRDRWAPYAIAGAGLLWNTIHQDALDPHGSPVVHHYDQFNGALHTGAGLRYYLGDKWGIRPEFKVIVSKEIYYRLSVGIFYVIPTTLP